MTCRELTDLLAQQAAGELPQGLQIDCNEHLEACPDCAAYLQGYLTTVELVREAYDPAIAGLK
jgi:anti-sigma factor RsiW